MSQSRKLHVKKQITGHATESIKAVNYYSNTAEMGTVQLV